MINDKESMTTWLPVKNFSHDFFIQSIIYDKHGLTINLTETNNRNRKLIMIFKEGVKYYRTTDEWLSINALQGNINVTDDAKKNGCLPMFKVTNSEYLQWASKQLQGIDDHMHLTHFAISTIEVTLEILCWYEPHVEIIEIE